MAKRKIMLLLLLLMALLSVQAQAVDTQRPVTLTIDYQCGGKPAAGVAFQLYRVAEVSSSGTFTLTGDFQGYPVSLEDQSTAGWRNLATTLEGYAQRDQLTPSAQGSTDQQGKLTFPAEGDHLSPGLYLVLGAQYVAGRCTYSAEPFLVALPDQDAYGRWRYDVTVEPKYTVWEEGDPPRPTVKYSVRKIWNDGDRQDSRPASVTVQLLRNGRVYDTVTLDQSNAWRHTWNGLDPSAQWTVVEQEVPGYQVLVTQEGRAFLVINTRDGPDDPEPSEDPGPTDDPKPSDQPGPTDDPKPSDQPGPSDNPKPSDHPKPSDQPDQPGNSQKPDNSQELPNTGVLWWPVFMLLAAGLLLLVLGCVSRRRRE